MKPLIGIKAGYQLSITSYEGDGVNHTTQTVDALSIVQVQFNVSLLQDLKKITEDWTDEKLHDLIQKHAAKFPGMDKTGMYIFNYQKEDTYSAICDILLGYLTYWDNEGVIKQVSSLKVIWVEQDCYSIPLEEFYT